MKGDDLLRAWVSAQQEGWFDEDGNHVRFAVHPDDVASVQALDACLPAKDDWSCGTVFGVPVEAVPEVNPGTILVSMARRDGNGGHFIVTPE